MVIRTILSFVGKKELVALAVLASAFTACMAFSLSIWSFVAVSLLFIGYVSWTASSFFISQQNFSGKRIVACALPVGFAMVETFICFGLAWTIVWSVRHLFGS